MRSVIGRNEKGKYMCTLICKGKKIFINKKGKRMY